MINSVVANNLNFKNADLKQKNASNASSPMLDKYISQLPSATPKTIGVTTFLSDSDKQKYEFLLNFLKNEKPTENSYGLTPNKQLDNLLRSGKLLAKSNSDGSTTLDNLYDIAKKERNWGLNQVNLIKNTLDIISNPKTITQTFGDIPINEKQNIVNSLSDTDAVKQNPSLMNVTASGTCAAAAIEVNLADNYPAEFARWVSKLSSKDEELYLNVKLSSLSKNKLDAITILDLLEAQKVSFDFDKVKIKVSLDDNSSIRAKIQDKYWDLGERNVADVLVQSAIMQLGSQNTYNSLADIRGGKFNSNSQGLIEIEKTFVESLVKDKEITSLVYQKIDDDQNLIGYNCSFDMMQKHLINALDKGNDIIIGYVLTNETAGRTTSNYYNPATDGAPNKVINGHEITIVDYKVLENGKVKFICIDTDDDNNNFVEYSADWLLPKLHHAGYPANLVEEDEKIISRNAQA